MAQGRFLSRTVSTSEQLASGSVSLEAALFFTWCLPHLDVDGRLTGSPARLKGTVCPLRDEISVERIPGLLGELIGAQLVRWYRVGEVRVLSFPGFENHQQGLRRDREAASKLPEPHHPDVVVLPENSGSHSAGSTPGVSREESMPEPGEPAPRLSEGQVKGRKDPIANAIGAGRRPADALDDLGDRALMQLVRRHLYVPNGRAPKGWAEGRDVKIIRQLRRRGHSGLQIGAAIEGLALMREASEFDWLPRSAKATMRALLNTRHGVRDLFSAAQDWYWKHAESQLEKQRAAERDAGVGKSQPQHVGDLLTAAMPPRAHP